jgi:hypothetical protein
LNCRGATGRGLLAFSDFDKLVEDGYQNKDRGFGKILVKLGNLIDVEGQKATSSRTVSMLLSIVNSSENAAGKHLLNMLRAAKKPRTSVVLWRTAHMGR